MATRAVTLCLPVLFLLGCRTSVDVTIEGDDTAGGTINVAVELDDGALDVLGGPDVFELDDLEGTGWVLVEPTPVDDGYRLEAERAFADGEDLQAGLDELAGPGVFSGVVSVVDRSFARTEAELAVDVSITGEPALFSDAALTETLGGLPVGYTPEELAFIGATEPRSTTVTLRVQTPGGELDEVSLDLVSGEPQSATLRSTGSDRDQSALMLGAGGAVLVLAGMVLVGLAVARRLRTCAGVSQRRSRLLR